MSIVRRVARPLLALEFIYGGADVLRNPEPRAKLAAPIAKKIADALPMRLPEDPVQLVRIDAGVKVAGGLLLATGRVPRLAALALAASLVPTTLAGHRFWEFDEPQQRANQRIHFLKNLSLLGGLLVAAVDTEGRPSVGYRARKLTSVTRGRTRKAALAARKSLPGD